MSQQQFYAYESQNLNDSKVLLNSFAGLSVGGQNQTQSQYVNNNTNGSQTTQQSQQPLPQSNNTNQSNNSQGQQQQSQYQQQPNSNMQYSSYVNYLNHQGNSQQQQQQPLYTSQYQPGNYQQPQPMAYSYYPQNGGYQPVQGYQMDQSQQYYYPQQNLQQSQMQYSQQPVYQSQQQQQPQTNKNINLTIYDSQKQQNSNNQSQQLQSQPQINYYQYAQQQQNLTQSYHQQNLSQSYQQQNTIFNNHSQQLTSQQLSQSQQQPPLNQSGFVPAKYKQKDYFEQEIGNSLVNRSHLVGKLGPGFLEFDDYFEKHKDKFFTPELNEITFYFTPDNVIVGLYAVYRDSWGKDDRELYKGNVHVPLNINRAQLSSAKLSFTFDDYIKEAYVDDEDGINYVKFVTDSGKVLEVGSTKNENLPNMRENMTRIMGFGGAMSTRLEGLYFYIN